MRNLFKVEKDRNMHKNILERFCLQLNPECVIVIREIKVKFNHLELTREIVDISLNDFDNTLLIL